MEIQVGGTVGDTACRTLSGDHSAWLHQALGMQDYEALPEKLVERYWELKRVYDRTGGRLTQHEIGMAVFVLGYGAPIDSDPHPPTMAIPALEPQSLGSA